MLADLEASEGIVGAATNDYNQLKDLYTTAHTKQAEESTNRFDNSTLDREQKKHSLPSSISMSSQTGSCLKQISPSFMNISITTETKNPKSPLQIELNRSRIPNT